MSFNGDAPAGATPAADNSSEGSPEQTPPVTAAPDQVPSAADSADASGPAAAPLAAMPKSPQVRQPAQGGIRGSSFAREHGQPASPRIAGAPGPAGDHLTPLQRAEGVLPRRTGGASRLSSALGAFARGSGAHAKNSSRRPPAAPGAGPASPSATPGARQQAGQPAGPGVWQPGGAPAEPGGGQQGPGTLSGQAADQAALSRAELNRAALDRAARAWTAAGQQLTPQQTPGQPVPGSPVPGSRVSGQQPAVLPADEQQLAGQPAVAQATPSAAALTRGQARQDAQPAGLSAGGNLLPAELTVSVAPSRLDRFRHRWRELDHVGQLDGLITGPRLLRCATIAMVSPKGGVGKTTITALLGTLFSQLRRDPTVAIDTNPDFGSLGRVLTPDQSWFVDDLAALVAEDDELSLTALDSHLGRAVHGLLVVPAPTDPDRMAALDEDAYARVIGRLKDFFSLILLDCGTGLQDPASAAAIAAADQVVLLTDAQPATASLVTESAELLHQWNRPITVVVNRMPARGAQLDVQALSQYLPAARGLVVVPDDVPAAGRLAGGSFDWRDAPPSWQLALRRLAVVLVSDWQRLGLSR